MLKTKKATRVYNGLPKLSENHEICVCGHPKSSHEDLVIVGQRNCDMIENHAGECTCGKCRCSAYTWASH